MEQRKLC